VRRTNGSSGLLENQPLSLYPANSLFVNGYLTTPGQEASETHRMIADLGFEIEDRLPI
jgi:biotin synthase